MISQSTRRGFGSDNHSPVHPLFMQAIQECNLGHAPSYGTDAWSQEVDSAIKENFGPTSVAFFVFNGTAANVLSLKALLKSHESVLCSDVSHLNVDECGAPEFFTGSKLVTVPSFDGKIRVQDLDNKLIRRGDQHFSQVRMLSITQPTELGTVYSVEEMQVIQAWCKKNQILLHVDGARLANACAYLKLTFRQMMDVLSPDVVSLGGTKNGMLFGEAVIFRDEKMAKEFKYTRKQAAQLPSKTRFLAASFLSYLKQNNYLKIAEHSLAMARSLREMVESIEGVKVTRPTESNAVFACVPKSWISAIREQYFFYVWDESTFECRWMTSWDTQITEIEGFANTLKEISTKEKTK